MEVEKNSSEGENMLIRTLLIVALLFGCSEQETNRLNLINSNRINDNTKIFETKDGLICVINTQISYDHIECALDHWIEEELEDWRKKNAHN